MASSKDNAQQVCKLLPKSRHVVTIGFEQLQQGAQVRRGQRDVAAVVWRIAVHQIVYAASEVLLV